MERQDITNRDKNSKKENLHREKNRKIEKGVRGGRVTNIGERKEAERKR